MQQREITIGRDNRCDIRLDGGCRYASNQHASLYVDGYQLMLRDYSTNGTLVNNILVRGRATIINQGDSIMIAGRYPLSWNVINQYITIPKAINKEEVANDDDEFPDTDKWSWGAFSLYGIWGFFNGCWWAFLIAIFFGWSFIPNIVFGIKGRDLAWNNRNWRSAHDFNHTQDSWDSWGLAIFVINILILLLYIIIFAAIFSSF